jgi:DNA-binding SARP family transcriptional activator
MEFGLLGVLEVRAGDGPVRLPARKQRALLALLLLNANRVVARERLIDGLWGDGPPETAVKALQVYVSQLRKLLPAGTLVTRPPGYLLAVEPEAVDLLRFERLVAEARQAEPGEAAVLLREALGLWRGPPLGEFADEPFARIEAGRLEELRLAAVEERIEADLRLDRHAELIAELEALVAEQPHRERLRAQLMLSLYRSGRQADALEAYRAARAALDELGLEPGVPLRQLERQILAQDRELDLRREGPQAAGRVALPGPLVPESPFPFVGREHELATLRSLLERAEGGEGGLVLLAGEAGSGKTRLLRELAHETAARGVLVLYGVSDATVSMPYQPLREWVEFVLRVCDSDVLRECLGEESEPLARLVPKLASLTGPPAPSGDPESERYLLQSAVTELLRRLSERQPLLLVADDVHWADGETLHLIRRLGRAAPEARLLVLAAYREPGERISPALADTLAELARLDAVKRVSLGNLSPEEMGEFVRVAAEAEARPELLFALAELTDGTPLLLCELWRELSASGAVEISESGVRLTRRLAELRGPERIVDLVQHRLSRLAPETTALVELAAVAGPHFELRVVADAVGLDPSALVAALNQARRNGMIEDLSEPTGACRFTHELIRRAVYDRIPGIRRAELHQHYADRLESVAGDRAADYQEILGYHLEQAYRYRSELGPVDEEARVLATRAGRHLGTAGRRAFEHGDLEAVTNLLGRATTLLPEESRERLELMVPYGYALSQSARTAEAMAVDEEVERRAILLGERGLAAHARANHLEAELWDADTPIASMARLRPEDQETTARELIATFEQLGDEYGLAKAKRLMGFAVSGRGRSREGGEWLEQALVHANTHGDGATRRQVTQTLSITLTNGPVPVPIVTARLHELQAASRDDRVLTAVLSRHLGLLAAMEMRFDESREYERQAREVLDEANILTPTWIYRGAAAHAKRLAGDLTGAEQEHAETFAHFRKIFGGEPGRLAVRTAWQAGLVCCDAGRWERAEEWYAVWHGQDSAAASRSLLAARLAAHRGDVDEALEIALAGVEQSQGSDSPDARADPLVTLAEVLRVAGRHDEADEAIAQAIEIYEAKGNVAAAGALRGRVTALK